MIRFECYPADNKNELSAVRKTKQQRQWVHPMTFTQRGVHIKAKVHHHFTYNSFTMDAKGYCTMYWRWSDGQICSEINWNLTDLRSRLHDTMHWRWSCTCYFSNCQDLTHWCLTFFILMEKKRCNHKILHRFTYDSHYVCTSFQVFVFFHVQREHKGKKLNLEKQTLYVTVVYIQT